MKPEVIDRIATEIMHVSRRLLQRSTRVTEQLGIGAGQVPILKLLDDCGTLTQRQIAERIRVTPATICGTIKRMERAGLITRSATAKDARISCISLTEDGRVRCAQAVAAIKMPYGEMLDGFSKEECEQLAHFVQRMSANLLRAIKDEEQNEE